MASEYIFALLVFFYSRPMRTSGHRIETDESKRLGRSANVGNAFKWRRKTICEKTTKNRARFDSYNRVIQHRFSVWKGDEGNRNIRSAQRLRATIILSLFFFPSLYLSLLPLRHELFSGYFSRIFSFIMLCVSTQTQFICGCVSKRTFEIQARAFDSTANICAMFVSFIPNKEDIT